MYCRILLSFWKVHVLAAVYFYFYFCVSGSLTLMSAFFFSFEFSANALVMNDDCQTPLEIARAKGHSNVVRAIEVCVMRHVVMSV